MAVYLKGMALGAGMMIVDPVITLPRMAVYLKGMALGAGMMIIDLLNAAIRDLHFVLGIRPS
jgi:hypothetical protein